MASRSGERVPSFSELRRGPFVPGRNASPEVLEIKRAHLRDPHVQPLNELADVIAESEELANGLVPYVDPQLGGVHAEVLAVLDNPSTKAEAGTGSGLLSLENDDPTARYCAGVYNSVGLEPRRVVHWNAAPAPISGVKNGASSVAERQRGSQWLCEVVDHLPNLEVVLLMGGMARDGWARARIARTGLVLPADVPHPSARGLANRAGRERFRRALRETMSALDSGRTPSGSPSRGEGALMGWWPSFEHYSAPGSNPWGVSTRMDRLETAMDAYMPPPKKWCVIGRRTRSGWELVAKRAGGRTVQMTATQLEAYDRARRGGSRGNLGEVPPVVELSRRTDDLDR